MADAYYRTWFSTWLAFGLSCNFSVLVCILNLHDGLSAMGLGQIHRRLRCHLLDLKMLQVAM